jgi:hypothetical protein
MRNLIYGLFGAVLGLVKFVIGVTLFIAAVCVGQTPD